MQRWLLVLVIVGLCVVAAACSSESSPGTRGDSSGNGGGTQPPPTSEHDWVRFGRDVASTSSSPDPTKIDSANVATLTRQQVTLDGVVDASAIYLHAVQVNGATHNALFVTTIYGRTIALDANDGSVLWQSTPSTHDQLAGTYRITTATPVADPSRQYIYAAAPDGDIRKLSVANGSVVWTTPITLLPAREKIASPLNLDRGHVIAVTGGYIGDAPPYQGHVALIDAATGNLESVWNSLCSDRTGLIQPSSCAQSGSAIWGRAGAVIDSTTGNMYVATGNGLWDGRTNWGDAVIALSADASTIVANYTPTNTETLNASDADIGSTSPVLLGGGIVVQGGKDATLRLLDATNIAGATGHRGQETQSVPTPSHSGLFTAPAVWRNGGTTWVFGADGGGTSAWTVSGGRLAPAWQNSNGGTSPVVAGGLLFVYDPSGGVRVYVAATGHMITKLETGAGHWNSPIVIDGMVVVPEGNANNHGTKGVLNIFRLP
ncbi:MAG TPA: PQQ-binding-like beta-propeller repeat protein [Gemmatimonadaceae bacterium]